MRLVEALVPARLGRGFRWLLGSVLAGNLGDGIALAAGPLLVASQTRDPFLVASASFLQKLPWLLFGVLTGVVVDRVDRRRLVVLVDVLRALVLLALVGTILTGVVDIVLVLVALFLLGTAETFSDLTSRTLLVGLVDKGDLGVANARLQGGFIVANQLVGPPIGAALFVAGAAWPLVTTALCYLLAAGLATRLVLRPREPRDSARPVRAEISEGLRWLLHHPPLRTLALTIVLFNVTFGAAWGVLVLWSQDRLDLSEAGYGLLITASAVGGLAGTAAYGWLERVLGHATLMRVGLVLETLTHLGLALTTSTTVALGILLVFGAHAFVWGTTVETVRQRSVPYDLQGRVGSVYMIGVFAGMLVGTPVGGLLARAYGITAPFWFGFVGSAILVVVLWRQLGHLGRRS